MKQNETASLCLLFFFIGYLALAANLALRGDDGKPAEVAPKVAPMIAKSVTLELPSREGNPRNSEGDFIRLNSGDILYTWDGKHIFKGKSHYSGDILYTWDGEHLYKGNSTYSGNILYTWDGEYLYKGNSTYSGNTLATTNGSIPIPILLLML